ncbi:MAG TPA: carboxypeptidase-like regulatory domain-containing protein, partial [Devosia sp.]
MIRMILAAALCCGALPAFAGSVSGTVVDEAGAPMAGVHVEVVYQTYRADQLNGAGESIKRDAVTGADGSYAISTDGMPLGEYAANAYEEVVNGGQTLVIDLAEDDSTTFAHNADVVRNFTGGVIEMSEDMPYGNAGIFVLNNAIGDFT